MRKNSIVAPPLLIGPPNVHQSKLIDEVQKIVIKYSYAMHTNEKQNNSYFKVLSQLPVTKTFISGIQAISLMGASCMATVTG